MAYGGNFYALVRGVGGRHGRRPGALGRADRPRAGDHGRDQPRRRARAPRGRADLRLPPRRLLRGRRRGGTRNATAIEPGWLDRSPCGTGTSARMAQLHARGELALGEDFVNESVIGTRFTGRLVEETTVGGLPGGRAGDHRPRVGDRDGPVPARRRAIRSPRASRCERARTSSCVGGGHRRRLRGARARARRRERRGDRARRRLGRGLLVGQRRPARAEPRAADRGARVAARRARLDGPARLAVRAQAQAVAGAVAGALPAGLDGAARRTTARRCSASCAARASALFRELAAEGIDGGFDEPGCLTVHTSADAEEHAAAEAASETGPRARRAGAERRRGAGAGAGADRARPRRGAVPRRGALRPGAAGGRGRRRRGRARGAAAHGRRGVRGRAGRRRRRPTGRSAPGPSSSRRARGRAGWPGPPACGSRCRAARATRRSGTRRPRRCGCRSTCTTSAWSPTRWATARG